MNPALNNQHKRRQQRADRTANSYDQHAFIAQEIGQRLLDKLDFIRYQPKQIVDLGSGCGTLSMSLRQRFKKATVYCLDSAHQRSLLCADQYARLKPVTADIHALPFADQSLDMVFSNQCFYWANIERVFAEIKRVLAPGGLLLFSSLGPDTLGAVHHVLGQRHVEPFADMHDIGDVLLKTEFINPVMDMEKLTVNYTSLYQWHQDLKQTGENGGQKNVLLSRKAYQQLCQLFPGDLEYEVVYGHAWGSAPQTKNTPGLFSVAVSKIGRRQQG